MSQMKEELSAETIIEIVEWIYEKGEEAGWW